MRKKSKRKRKSNTYRATTLFALVSLLLLLALFFQGISSISGNAVKESEEDPWLSAAVAGLFLGHSSTAQAVHSASSSPSPSGSDAPAIQGMVVASGDTLYASSSGSGSACSSASPCSLSTARSSASSGDTILLYSGSYGAVDFTSTDVYGSADNWIIYRAASGETPVFSRLSFEPRTEGMYLEFDGITIDYSGVLSAVSLRFDVSYLNLVNLEITGVHGSDADDSSHAGIHLIAPTNPASSLYDITHFDHILVEGNSISTFVHGIAVEGNIGEEVVIKNNHFNNLLGDSVLLDVHSGSVEQGLGSQDISSQNGLLGTTNTLSRWGITWTFEDASIPGAAVQYGQFVNGDWWVVDPGSGVKVTAINPSPSGGRHGSMVNPLWWHNTNNFDSINYQAYDSRINRYDPILLFDEGEILRANDSLVSTGSFSTKVGNAYLEKAAVLTVLSEIPPADAFRPGYAGTSKVIHRLSDVHQELLPRVQFRDLPPIENYEPKIEKFWLDHITNNHQRGIHPPSHMPEYGREISNLLGTIALMLIADYDNKTTLLTRYLQIGIDYYYAVQSGYSSPGDGGQGHGRKWPIIFAGIMLDDPLIKNGSHVGHHFGEDDQTDFFYVDAVGKTVALWGVPKSAEYYPPLCTPLGSNQFPNKEGRDPDDQFDACPLYRECCSSKTWYGANLAARILRDLDGKTGKELWGHDAHFDYLDRHYNRDDQGYTKDGTTLHGIGSDSFFGKAWADYRYCETDADCAGNPMGSSCVSIPDPCRDCSWDGKKECQGLPICTVDADCNDENMCTTDVCDIDNPSANARGCVYSNVPVGTSCSDGLFCNGEEVCSAGVCSSPGAACADDGYSCTSECNEATDSCEVTYNHASCSDGNACTDDSCIGAGGDANGCSFVNDDSNTCSDGYECTTSDSCSSGVCVGGGNDASVCLGHHADCSSAECNPSLAGADVYGCANYAPAQCDIPPGLEIHLRAEDDSSDGADDSSPNGYSLTCSDCPGYVSTGSHDGSGYYQFSGSNGLSISDGALSSAVPGVSSGSESFTVAAWIKRDLTGARHPIITKENNQGRGIVYEINDADYLRLQVRTTLDANAEHAILSDIFISDTDWHHVAATFDSGSGIVQLYIDGAAHGSGSLPATVRGASAPLRIGQYVYSSTYNVSFEGGLDDVRIYSRALDAAEVAILADTPPPVVEPCVLSSAAWSALSANHGDTVSLNVVGLNCVGKELNYTIYEDDVFDDDFMTSFISASLTPTWSAVYDDEGGLDPTPEYIYTVSEVADPTNTVDSSGGTLSVSAPSTPTVIFNPMPAALDIGKNTEFMMEYTVTCEGGDCGDVSVTLDPVVTTPSGTVNEEAGTIEQWGITWEFDKPLSTSGSSGTYRYGQFANGDFWVLGPVTLDRIQPDSSGGLNGWEVDPVAQSNDQPFDNRMDWVSYDAALQPSLPYLANPAGQGTNVMSIVKSISRTDGGACNRQCLKTASVLTVVSEVPENGGISLFRPAYIRSSSGNKAFYSANDLRLDVLPSLLSPPNGTPSLSWVENRYRRVQLDHTKSVIGVQWLHPQENMAEYGRDLTKNIGRAALVLAVESAEDKHDAAMHVAQAGIDFYEMLQSGRRWSADGGHASGRKFHILFAGHLLNHAGMLNIGKAYAPIDKAFAEDTQVFYTNDNPHLPGVPSASSLCYPALPAGYGPPYARYALDIHTQYSKLSNSGEPRRCDGNTGPSHQTYLKVNAPSWVGQVLAAHMYGLADEWNNSAYFDFQDRYMETDGYMAGSNHDSFNTDMWWSYRETAGQCQTAADCLDKVCNTVVACDATHPQADVQGCVYAPVSDGTSCADNLYCNGEETCSAGSCQSGVAVSCPVGDKCDEPTDSCVEDLCFGITSCGQIGDAATCSANECSGVSSLCTWTGSACEESTCIPTQATWVNIPFPERSNVVTIEFDATPSASNVDYAIGITHGDGNSYSDFPVIVRLNSTGFIDARNGGRYGSDALLSYSSGTTYEFQIIADLSLSTYDVHVGPAGGPKTQIADDYAFRSDAPSASTLNRIGMWESTQSGIHNLCNVETSEGGSPPVAKGVVPLDSGTPFYVSSGLPSHANPITCTLNEGESCMVSWTVNATGSAGSAYDMFAIAEFSGGVQNSDTTSVSIDNPLSQPPPDCVLDNAIWNRISVVDGESVDLLVSASNCGELNYTIYESDPFVADTIVESFTSTSLNPSWTAQHVGDWSGDPEFYFRVQEVGNPVNRIISSGSMLQVVESAGTGTLSFAPVASTLDMPQGETTTVQYEVTCSGGDCGAVNVTLDPVFSWTHYGFDITVAGATSMDYWNDNTHDRYLIVPAGDSVDITVIRNSQMRLANGALSGSGHTHYHVGPLSLPTPSSFWDNADTYSGTFNSGPITSPTPVKLWNEHSSVSYDTSDWKSKYSNAVNIWLIPDTHAGQIGNIYPVIYTNGLIPYATMGNAPMGEYPALYYNAADEARLRNAIDNLNNDDVKTSRGADGTYLYHGGGNYLEEVAEDAALNALIGWHKGSAAHIAEAKEQLLAIFSSHHFGNEMSGWKRSSHTPSLHRQNAYGRDVTQVFFEAMMAASALGPNMVNALTADELETVNAHLYSYAIHNLYASAINAMEYTADGGHHLHFHPIIVVAGWNWDYEPAKRISLDYWSKISHSECVWYYNGGDHSQPDYAVRACQGNWATNYYNVGNIQSTLYFARFGEYFSEDMRDYGEIYHNVEGLGHEYGLHAMYDNALVKYEGQGGDIKSPKDLLANAWAPLDMSQPCISDAECSGNACNDAVCDSTHPQADAKGCVLIPKAEGTSCSDGLFCNGDETCSAGTCTDAPDHSCPVGETCDEPSDSCVADPCFGITHCADYADGASCNANGCSVGAVCGWSGSVCEELPCSQTDGTWVNIPFPDRSNIVTIEYDVSPFALGSDYVIGVKEGDGTAYNQFPIIVRFNTTNRIDARNNNRYDALATLYYSAGSTYHVRIVADLSASIYDAFITPPGQSEVQIADDYGFRDGMSGFTTLNRIGIYDPVASNVHSICNIETSESGSPPPPPAKGVIPLDSGTPFYISDGTPSKANPQTCNLNNGESCILTWDVVPTGTVGSSHDMFAIAESVTETLNSDTTVVTITAGTPPVGDNVYVRDGSSGDGSSWSSALDDLPSTLERGKTYYIAAGTYAGYTFDDAANGQDITIKKATISDHGTAIGWSDSYAGQATFGPLRFNADDILFEGVDQTLRILGTAAKEQIMVHVTGDNVRIRNADLDGNFQYSGSFSSGTHTVGACNALELASTSSGTVIENNHIHNLADDGMSISGSNQLIKNNVIHGMYSYGTDGSNGNGPCNNGHSDAFEVWPIFDSVIEGNFIYELPHGTSGILFIGGVTNSNNLVIRNNIFYTYDVGLVWTIRDVDGLHVYNNVIMGSNQGGHYGGIGFGNDYSDINLYNNIITNIKCDHAVPGFSPGYCDQADFDYDNNLYVNNPTGVNQFWLNTNDKVDSNPGFVGIDPAVENTNPTLADFALVSTSPAVDAGTSTGAPAADMLGNARVGLTDIGPLEFSDTSCSTNADCSGADMCIAGECQPPAGLVAHWDFENTLVDDIGGHTGTFAGDAEIKKELFGGNSLFLDGDGDYMSVPHSSDLNLQKHLTLSAWIKPYGWGESGFGRIVSKGVFQGQGYSFHIRNITQSLGYLSYAGPASNSNEIPLIEIEQWRHVVVTYDGANARYYVNGLPQGSPVYTDDPGDSVGEPLIIGNRGGDFARDFHGFIDNVMLFDRPLSSTEILDLYRQQTVICQDTDEDFYGIVDLTGCASEQTLDCNDNNPNVYPDNTNQFCNCNDADGFVSGPEVCDGADNDCDGIIDGESVCGVVQTFYMDSDLDTHFEPVQSSCAAQGCFAPLNSNSVAGNDCGDNDPNTYPGAPEICDTIDNDCDGLTDTEDPDFVSCSGSEQCISGLCCEDTVAPFGVCDSFVADASLNTSVTQYGITWTFDKPYFVGQFIGANGVGTGDYFVIDDGSGVVVDEVSPLPSGGRHGSMINPEALVSRAHAYDKDIEHYDASYGVGYPVTLHAGDSLISTVSLLDGEPRKTVVGDEANSGIKIKKAAVLTVLDAVPAADTFRPAYAGTDKKLFRKSDIDYSKLAKLPVPTGGEDYDFEDINAIAKDRDDSYDTIAEQFSRYFQRPWILHVHHATGRLTHAIENMPDYHSDVYNIITETATLLLLDLDSHYGVAENELTDKLLIPFLQLGIDTYYVGQSGDRKADSSMHRFPTLFAGHLFGDADMLNDNYGSYRHLSKFYYIAPKGNPYDQRLSQYDSEMIDDGQIWTGYPEDPDGKIPAFRKQPDKNYEHEHLHPDPKDSCELAGTCGGHKVGGWCKQESYRNDVSGNYVGIVLAIRSMNLESAWNYDTLLDYVDRWKSEDNSQGSNPACWAHCPKECSSGRGSGSGFISRVWNEYSAGIAQCTDNADCVDANVCTTEVCDPTHVDANAQGCVFNPVADGTSCADSLYCNGEETCQAGSCSVGTPVNCAVGQTCDEPTDSCVADPCFGISTCADYADQTSCLANSCPVGAVCEWTGSACQAVACTQTAASWVNIPFPEKSGVVTVEFDAIPVAQAIDYTIGVSNGAGSAWGDFPVTVRFAGNVIDVRNAGTYTADATVGYTAGTSYHFRIIADLSTDSYDVFVTPQGSSEVQLASSYAFRTGHSGLTSLNNVGIYDELQQGPHNICTIEASEGAAPECVISSAAWSMVSAVEGDVVQLNVAGSNCVGKQLNYTIYEDDLVTDDFVYSFVSTSVNPSWTTQYVDDGVGDPEYYYEVHEVTDPANTVQSSGGLLAVSEGAGSTIPQDYTAYWRFETDPTVGVVDETGNYGGTCSSCPSQLSDQIVSGNGAYYFDGTDQKITITNSYTPGSTGTVLFWVSVDDITRRNRILGGADSFESVAQSGQVRNEFFAASSAFTAPNELIANNEWKHYALTWDSNTGLQQIYVDGAFDNSGSHADDPPGSFNLLIGHRPSASDAEHFQGKLDNVMIYDRVLTPQEIAAIHSEQSSGVVAPECSIDADCDNGLYCDGAETCNAGSCQAGTVVSCPVGQTCSEIADACVEPVAGDMYVSSSGSGTTCSSADPCSLDYAKSNAQPGDTVILKDGNYGTHTFDLSGSSGQKVTFESENKLGALFTQVTLNGDYLLIKGVLVNNSLVPRPSVDAPQEGVSMNGMHNELDDSTVIGAGRHTVQPIAVKMGGSSNILSDSDVSQGHKAVEVTGNNHIIRNNDLHASAGSTLRVWGSGHLIERNLVHDAHKTKAQDAWCAGGDLKPEWRMEIPFDEDGSGEIEWGETVTYCPPGTVRDGQETGYSWNGPHRNLISGRGVSDITIRGNILWDSDIPTLRIRDTTGGSPSGANIVIENNVLSQFFGYSGEYTVRNNIISTASFGSVSGSNGPCKVDEFSNNIVRKFEYATSGNSICTQFDYKDYNILVPACRNNFGCSTGSNTVTISSTSEMEALWSQLFVDYQGINDRSDFHINSDVEVDSGRVAIDFGPTAHAALTDKDGNTRVDMPGVGNNGNDLIADAGIYEMDGEAPVECTVDADCDNGLYCDGAETCNAGSCQAGTAVSCPVGQICDETTDACVVVVTPDELYVSPSGSGAACTSAAPCSLDYAKANAAAGNEVLLKSGNYGDVTFTSSDTKGNNWAESIVYKPDTGATPVWSSLTIDNIPNAYIEIDGITIEYSGPTGSSTAAVDLRNDISFFSLKNMLIEGVNFNTNSNENSIVGTGIRFVNGANLNNILVENNEITRFNRALQLGSSASIGPIVGDNLVIKNNNLHYVASSGMRIHAKLGNQQILIEGNRIYDQVSVYKGGGTPGSPTERTHSSGISIRNDNLIVRNNTIHNIGNTAAIRTYQSIFPVSGYQNMLFENNLLYDPHAFFPLSFHDIGSNFIIRRNTVIGPDCSTTGWTCGSNEPYFFGVWFENTVDAADVNTLVFENNLIVGNVDMDSTFRQSPNIANNILYDIGPDWNDGSPNAVDLPADNVVYHPDLNAYDNFFEGSVIYDFKHGQNLDNEFVPNSATDACPGGTNPLDLGAGEFVGAFDCPGVVVPADCSLTSAVWNTAESVEGQTVQLVVQGSDCNGEEVQFAVFEDDTPAGAEPAQTNPATVTFSGNSATATWTTEWQCDGDVFGVCTFGNPEYYYVATLASDNTETIQSADPLLVVTAVSPTCGNGIVEGTEECDDGNSDTTDSCTNVCMTAECGDGIVHAGIESCDDGNSDNTDACTNSCAAAVCGDGFVHIGVEDCDDNNSDNTDDCTNSCESPVCGDGFVHVGVEDCDDSNSDNTDDCTNSCAAAVCGDGFIYAGFESCDDGNSMNTDACTNSCDVATCGDGITQTGVEACDDGNSLNTDSCTNSCTAAVCGDGFFHVGVETCDDGNSDNTDSCTNSCAAAVCGDGFVHIGVEDCDDNNSDNTDACTNSCESPVCGDGFVHIGVESCDDGPQNGEPFKCNALCSGTTDPLCGNGAKEGDEECDDGNSDNTDSCTNACTTAICGDGITQTGVESCDDGNSLNTDSCTNTCDVAICGDGFVHSGVESCDDANSMNTDACTNSCDVAVCGDGFVHSGVESCDDANSVNTDACTNSCDIAVCGDGFVHSGVEACDDGNSDNTDSCTNSCDVAVCGDGIIQTGVEACDDGNSVDTDSCTNACQIAVCGDSIVHAGVETCDDANNLNTDACTNACQIAVCGDSIVHAGVESCDDANSLNTDSCTNSCEAAVCGDGFVHLGVESCDDGPQNGEPFKCNALCSGTTDPLCGNGAKEGDEECDDGNDNNTDSCTNACTTAICGDGIVHIGVEACDDGNSVDNDACTNSCQLAVCGDGIVHIGVEACDDANSLAADGCDATCEIESGWVCNALSPSACTQAQFCSDCTIYGDEFCSQSLCLSIPDSCGWNGTHCLAAEICDTIDNDGDGSIDEGCDDDNDDYCDAEMIHLYPEVLPEGVESEDYYCPLGHSDCSDADGTTHPGATEQCFDGIDNDCDGLIDKDDDDCFEACEPYDATLPYCITPVCVAGEWTFEQNDTLCDDGVACTVTSCSKVGCVVSLNESLSCEDVDDQCVDLDKDGILDYDATLCPIGTDECIVHEDDLTAGELLALHPKGKLFEVKWNKSQATVKNSKKLEILRKDIAKIEFRENVSLIRVNSSGCFEPLNLDTLIDMEGGKVVVHSADHSPFNKKAHITFYNIVYQEPQVRKDGVPCSDCTIVSYDPETKELVVEINGFSEYDVVEGYVPPKVSDNSGSSSGGGSGGGGSGAGSAGVTSKTMDLTTVWQTEDLRINGKLVFEHKDDIHRLYLDDVINTKTIDISIYSTRIPLQLRKGRIITVDLNADKENDIDVLFSGIFNSRARISLRVHTPPKPAPAQTDSTPELDPEPVFEEPKQPPIELSAPEAQGLAKYLFAIIVSTFALFALFFGMYHGTHHMHHHLLKWKYFDHTSKIRGRNTRTEEGLVDQYKLVELRSYVNSCLKWPYPKDRIKRACVDIGWKENIVDRVIKEEEKKL